jgi:hypothetical protein
MMSAYTVRMRSPETVRIAQRVYERNSEDRCSDLTEQVKTMGWPDLEKSLRSLRWRFPQIITCFLLDLHSCICPIRDCCIKSVKCCSGTFIMHGICTGSWDHKCKVLELCDSATPMSIFFPFTFFDKYSDVNSGWHLSLTGTGKDMGLELCQEVGVWLMNDTSVAWRWKPVHRTTPSCMPLPLHKEWRPNNKWMENRWVKFTLKYLRI